MVDSERPGQTLPENDPNSKYPKCQVFDLSTESNVLYSEKWVMNSLAISVVNFFNVAARKFTTNWVYFSQSQP